MRATVCVPTYNERENLEAMIRALGRVLRDGDRILVIDDASPDGTGEIADRLAAELPYVDVLHRDAKDGLGPAYIAGFRHLFEGDTELIVEIDADFSHDPNDLPRLIAATEAGPDLVLGSRYVAGGSIPNWGIARRVISAGGNWYGRTLLGLRIRDLTGGYKCFRREVLETVDLSAIDTKGYAFNIELTYRVVRAGFTVTEIPISFTDRTRGKSKMSLSVMAEAMLKVPRLRIRALTGRL